MPDPVRSLFDLVAEAHARCPTRDALRDWDDGDPFQVIVACQCLEDALAAAERGDFLSASKLAEESLDQWLPVPEEEVNLSPSGTWRKFLTARRAFLEVCELALRIDSFLAAILREKVAGALARECYEDLALLLVLADWAEENGRPATAAEARHLHSLVRYRER